MKLTFDIGIDDMMAYQAHHYDTSPGIKRLLKRRRLMLVVVVVCIALLLAMGLNELRWIGLSVYAVLVAVILFFDRNGDSYRNQWLKQVRAQIDVPENAGNYRQRTMVFEDDKVTVDTDVASSTLRWEAFTAAEQTTDYFFMSLSAQQAYVIPKRVMTGAQVEELTQLLNNKIKK